MLKMPHIERNILHIFFYPEITGEFLRIVCSTACLREFTPKTNELSGRMKKGSKYNSTSSPLREMILSHQESFQHVSILCQDLLSIR